MSVDPTGAYDAGEHCTTCWRVDGEVARMMLVLVGAPRRREHICERCGALRCWSGLGPDWPFPSELDQDEGA